MHNLHWTKPWTRDETLHYSKILALSHAAEGGEQGKRIADCIVSNDYRALCDFVLDYDGASAYQAGNCRQALAFFVKQQHLDLGIDREEAALIKFMEAEETCLQTNDIFRKHAQGSLSFDPWVESVLYRAQQKIASVLRECPTFEELRYRFGPGATTLTKKSRASVVEKLQAGISCSGDLLPYASSILEEMPHLADLHSISSRTNEGVEWVTVPVQVMSGELRFVPKSAKIDRSIIVEPSLNTMIQAAIGDLMTDRLLASGIDIRDQSINQKLALRGSLSGDLATLDLSSASDTICSQLVLDLLPLDWYLLLNLARSGSINFRAATKSDVTIQLEKFSSMGNGFTFPLETLIFWALSSAASEDGFASVYGDDIIVASRDVDSVIRTLTHCGFSVNMQKSYWSGPFRESCGADYIRGIDIRPYYQKNLLSYAELFKMHNYYVRRQDDERAQLIKSWIPVPLRLYGPDGYGDGHLIGDWSPKPHRRAITHGYGGYIFDTFVLSGRRDYRAARPGDRILPLYSTYMAEYDEGRKPTLSKGNGFDTGVCFVRTRGAFYARWLSYGLFPDIDREASLPIPDRVIEGQTVKGPSFPGTYGYHKISIYTFDRT